ncbi:CD109-like protein, partial [Mya arenaria]
GMLRVILLAAVVAVAAADDSYLIITPTDFRAGIPLGITVNILNGAGDVNVKADLVNEGTKATIATGHGSFTPGKVGTLTISVPDDVHSGSYKLHVQGSGHGLHFSNETSITFQSKSVSIFIQTDKATYKPGQTVNFRAFAVFPTLGVYDGTYDIDVYDPNTNKIKQWKGLQDAMLPKFEVKVEIPSFILTSDGTIDGKVTATYTYGKPVQGQTDIQVKLTNWYRPYNYHGDEPSATQSLTLNENGEAQFSISLDAIKQGQHYLNGHKIIVQANVTENLNQITLSGDSTVQFYDHAEKLHFLESNPNTFKPGLQYTAYLRVSAQDDQPLQAPRESLHVKTRATYREQGVDPTPYPWYQAPSHSYFLPEESLIVPDNGILPIQVDIPDNSTSISITVTYGKVTASLSLSKSYSPSDNYMQLSLKSAGLRAGDVAMFEVTATEPISNLSIQVMSRGSVVMSGTVTGSAFNVPVDAKMAPNARVIAYYVRADGEVVIDSISFDVSGVFENQVSISFDKTKATPGDTVNVVVTADPNSIVNLLAVDQSVLLLRGGNDVTPSEVVDELKSYDTIIHPRNNFCCDLMPMAVGRKKRMIWWPYPTYYGGSDAQSVIQNSGVKVMTDAVVFHHKEEIIFSPIRFEHLAMAGGGIGGGTGGAMPSPQGEYHGGFLGGGGGFRPVPASSVGAGTATGTSSHATAMKEPERIRNVFPETWLWSNSSTGADGSVTISTTVPDTITSWIASAFAVNALTGLGVADSPAKIEAFKPFFVSLNLPYSVVRGEQLALQANVFNYMDQDMDVLVTLKASNDFKSLVVDSFGNVNYVSQAQTENVHVPHGTAKSVFFPIVPAALGKIPMTVTAQSPLAADGVQRQLLVEAEGVPRQFSNPVMVDLKNVSTFDETVDISLPAGVVAGSQRVVVSAIGDLLGPTVNNLDKLLRMPTGCGEQTMLGLAPDVFVTNYLTSTNQLTGDIEEKAIGFMESGYQRELTYQHKDGSFSAFGDNDKSGSMWLTAFVTKTFHQAKKQIFIDDETIKRAVDWMIARQNADGSFPEPGRGGSASGVGLTAFVLIALLENNDLGDRISRSVSLATTYMESQIATTHDDYVLSLATYALTLAKSSSADAAYQKLQKDAIINGGTIHWHKAQTSTTSSHWQPSHSQANPIDIEMTSYALLVEAMRGDMSMGIPIMKWVTGQRNSNGGFSSTQDTVVALQALSDFAAKIYSNTFDITATVTAGTFTHTFNINKQNALVQQSVVLPSVPSRVQIHATGHGMALLDVGLSFNVEQEIELPTFQVDVTLVTETIDMLTIKTCTKWLQTGASGMAIQELGIPTGFEADLESLDQFTEIKRVETQDRKIILYFDEITPTPLCITVDVIRTGMVAKSQPAAVRVYDYYQPSNQVTSFYQSHVLQNADICDVCADFYKALRSIR